MLAHVFDKKYVVIGDNLIKSLSIDTEYIVLHCNIVLLKMLHFFAAIIKFALQFVGPVISSTTLPIIVMGSTLDIPLLSNNPTPNQGKTSSKS